MLTQAIVIGMTPEQFWDDDPSLFFNYVDAYKRKANMELKIEIEKMNFNAWLNGLYIDIALAVNHPLAKHKGKYIEKPIELNGSEEKQIDEEEKRKREEAIALNQFYQFGRFAKMYNKQYFGEEEGE